MRVAAVQVGLVDGPGELLAQYKCLPMVTDSAPQPALAVVLLVSPL
jgi:hypothetical protein